MKRAREGRLDNSATRDEQGDVILLLFGGFWSVVHIVARCCKQNRFSE